MTCLALSTVLFYLIWSKLFKARAKSRPPMTSLQRQLPYAVQMIHMLLLRLPHTSAEYNANYAILHLFRQVHPILALKLVRASEKSNRNIKISLSQVRRFSFILAFNSQRAHSLTLALRAVVHGHI